jgi:endonuclease/exonuclease/phosphatase family metal-dependent hydrolase
MSTHSRWVLLPALLALFVAMLVSCVSVNKPQEETSANGYLFCFWNVENLFDDREDHRAGADREYDRWFAQDADIRNLKYRHLSEALIRLNGGKGPDILAIVEVEDLRAAELLRDALNERLPEDEQYKHILMKELSAGRHIAPAIITRLPVRGNKTQLHGRQQRILEGHIDLNGNDLVLLVSHWTSRVSDATGEHRARYADQIYGTFKAMYRSNPKVSFLVCGDFNDTPDSPAVVKQLHSSGNLEQVVQAKTEPMLYNLFADKAPANFGTHYYHGKWFIFDQILVSPAMLGGGPWTVDLSSVETINTLVRPGDRKHRPWRFGSPKDRFERGYSDHFPVTVRLRAGGDLATKE